MKGHIYVAPFTGAWIEMPFSPLGMTKSRVAPFTGAWIEITIRDNRRQPSMVAPFTGAWIEIVITLIGVRILSSRSLHGSVD